MCTPQELSGVLLIIPKRFDDTRGYFMETYSSAEYASLGVAETFVQDNQSLSIRLGTVRGLHFQAPPKAQAKLVRVLRGSIFDVAVDLRIGSDTYGRWCSQRLTGHGGEQLFIPAGFAHGFCTLEPNTEILYKVDHCYSPGSESGLRWDDPDLRIDWPIDKEKAALSERDRKLPLLKTFISPFRSNEPVAQARSSRI